MIEALRLEARRLSWREGFAHEWALDEGQRKWRQDFINAPPLSSTVWNIGRQRGKSYDATFLNIEAGCVIRDAMLRYCAKTKDSALNIVMPSWDALVATMPEDLQPRPAGSDKPWRKGLRETEWIFPVTGATFFLFGTDAQSFSRGRGPRTDLLTLDEFGFYQEPLAVEAALLPSLQTTGGKALYPSTPPESMGHPYVDRIRAAQAAGRYQHDTFWSNPRVDHQAVIHEEASRLGMTPEDFVKSTYFRREYMAELVTEETRAAMPAWNEALHAEVVGDWERPQFFDGYQAHDPGITGDPHASLFAWHDFSRNELVIEDELEMRSATTTIGQWVEAIQAFERRAYGVNAWDGTSIAAQDWAMEYGGLPEYLQSAISAKAPRQPYLRVADNAQGVCREMSLSHKLALFPTDKNEKAFHADTCNSLLFQRRIRIHRRCKRLIEQLYSTVWNKTRSEWDRTPKDHGDLIDCLVYLSRNVRWHRDCRPVPKREEFAPPSSKKTGLDAMKGLLR